MGDALRALNVLGTWASDPTEWELAERSILRAAATSRAGVDPDEAFGQAILEAISSAEPELEAEAFFYRALHAFGVGDHERSVLDADVGAAVSCVIGDRAGGRNAVMSVPQTVARCLELSGMIRAANDDYRGALDLMLRAAAITRGAPDRWLDAFTLTNVAIFVRDLDRDESTREIFDDIAARALAFPWTPDLAHRHTMLAGALGTTAALAGDNVAAFRWYRRSAEVADAGPDQVVASLQRAMLAFELDHGVMAQEELEHALAISEKIDWSAAGYDHRLTLLVLAHVAAPTALASAREALATFERLSPAKLTLSQFERRVVALEHFARGVVARYGGDLSAATHHLESAYTIWTAIGFRWRAAQAALELAEMHVTKFAEAARAQALERPGSWLARRANSLA